MQECWIVYDAATGEERWRGSGPIGSGELQDVPAGLALAVVPQASIVGPSIDLTSVAAALQDRVDTEAGQFRSKFITVSPGQEMTYVFKAAEAKAWKVGASDADFPFLAAEASAGNRSIADVRAEVLYSTNLFITLGSRIEGARMAAKAAVASATNIKDMVAAATVNWDALSQP